MRDSYTQSLWPTRKWANVIGYARNNRDWLETNGNAGRICNECADALSTFSEVSQCAGCGKTGGKRRITYRSDCYHYSLQFDPHFCVSCWNKMRPLMAVVSESDDLRTTCRMLLSTGLKQLVKGNHEASTSVEPHHNRRLTDLLGAHRGGDGTRGHGVA